MGQPPARYVQAARLRGKEGRLLGTPSDLLFAHSDPLFTLHRAVRCREPWAGGVMSQPHCLLQNERMNGTHVTDEPGSQVSGPGTTSRSHTESTHNCRRKCRNGSIEWVSEACPPVCPCLLCGNRTPPPLWT